VARISLTPAELDTVRRILRRHVPGREVWIFGSRATGNAKEFSDLDLAIRDASSLPLSLLASLESDFEESELRFKVDLVDWAAASDGFRRIIRSQGVVLHSESEDDSRPRPDRGEDAGS